MTLISIVVWKLIKQHSNINYKNNFSDIISKFVTYKHSEEKIARRKVIIFILQSWFSSKLLSKFLLYLLLFVS